MRPVEDAPGVHEHDGFYLRLVGGSLGYSTLSAEGASGRTSMMGGAGGSLLLGGTPAPGLVVGGGLRQVMAYGHFVGGELDGTNASLILLSAGPFVDWYPSPKKGWHVGASAGVGLSLVDGRTTMHSLGSVGGSLFGGHDWWIGEQWSFGLLATVSGASATALLDSRGNDSGYRILPMSATLDATITFQ